MSVRKVYIIHIKLILCIVTDRKPVLTLPYKEVCKRYFKLKVHLPFSDLAISYL